MVCSCFSQGGCLHNTTSAKFILLGEKSSNRLNPQQILLIKKTSRKENTNDYDSFFFFSYAFNDQDLCLQAKMALHLCRLPSKLAKHNFQQRAHNQFRLLNFKVSRWPQ